MIIVKISSGLGNQLFQYATAKALTLRNNDILKLDISYFSNFNDRRYGLNYYNITDKIADNDEINKLKGSYKSNIYLKIKRRLSRKGVEFYNRYHVKELPYTSFEKSVLKLKGDIYLDGYWQNEQYFKDIRSELVQAFKPLEQNFDDYYNEVHCLIKSTNSVSVHVRRGDYLNNSAFAICTEQYYSDAFDLISEKIQNPVFFIFSDDPLWPKLQLRTHHKVVNIDHPFESKENVELFLMSQCAHNIIGNSSFSWWGAWLNCNPYKVVICPNVWLTDKKLNRKKTSNNFTLDWIKL